MVASRGEDEPPTKMSLPEKTRAIDSTWIKRHAHRLGFSLVGVTTPQTPPHLDVYDHWLKAGRHAGMDYLARKDAVAKRGDPRLLLPECQSIIVTGASYAVNATGVNQKSSDFQVAMYALGEDYHKVLVERLQSLVTEIEKEFGGPIPYRIYTDTGPLLERELAQRCGIGWIGKNTCLINPEQGSYFLLAELLLALPLQPDLPFIHDRCGSCTRCIDACPTKCILPDRTLDAGRCISYLTIENKDAVPHDLRKSIGDWIFGCDVCQQVCPWNLRFSKTTLDPAFEPGPFLREARLDDFLRLPPKKWRSSLRDSPMERPRRKGLVRNAAIVAGNHADEAWLDGLVHALRDDPEPLARAHAAWALGQIDGPLSKEVLENYLTLESNAKVREEIILALKHPKY